MTIDLVAITYPLASVAFAAFLSKAYGSDLAPYIYKMWIALTAWAVGFRYSDAAGFAEWSVRFVGGLV